MERKIVIIENDGLTTMQCTGIHYTYEVLGMLRVAVIRKEEQIRMNEQKQNPSVHLKTEVRKKKRK